MRPSPRCPDLSGPLSRAELKSGADVGGSDGPSSPIPPSSSAGGPSSPRSPAKRRGFCLSTIATLNRAALLDFRSGRLMLTCSSPDLGEVRVRPDLEAPALSRAGASHLSLFVGCQRRIPVVIECASLACECRHQALKPRKRLSGYVRQKGCGVRLPLVDFRPESLLLICLAPLGEGPPAYGP